jgi:hypothetical protein
MLKVMSSKICSFLKNEIFCYCLGCVIIDTGLSDFVQYWCDPVGVGSVCVCACACVHAMLLMFQRHKLRPSSG